MHLTIAAAQSASVPGEVARNAANHLRIATEAAAHGVQLLVFPELSLIGYELDLARANVVRPDAVELRPLREFAQKAKMTIVAGAPVANALGELHISALVFQPGGDVLVHTKEHVHSSEQHVFRSGPGGPPIAAGDAWIGLAICADASHPEHAAKAAARGADVYAAGVMIIEDAYARKAGLMAQYARDHATAALLANHNGWSGGELSAGRSAVWAPGGDALAVGPAMGEALIAGVREDGQWRGFVVTEI